VAMVESHAYELYSSRVVAEGEDGVLEFVDFTHLTPATISPKRPGLLGRFDVLGTLHLLTRKVLARQLGDRLHGLLQEHGEVLAGTSELPSGGGVTVRILGRQVGQVADAMQEVLRAARTAILGDRRGL